MTNRSERMMANSFWDATKQECGEVIIINLDTNETATYYTEHYQDANRVADMIREAGWQLTPEIQAYFIDPREIQDN